MTLTERLTNGQKAQIEAEQKRYDAAVKRAKREGREFDPLNDAPTAKKGDPVVQQAINKIWSGKKIHGE